MKREVNVFFGSEAMKTVLTRRWVEYFRNKDEVEVDTKTVFRVKNGFVEVQSPPQDPRYIYAKTHITPAACEINRQMIVAASRASILSFADLGERLAALQERAKRYVKDGAMEARDYRSEAQFMKEFQQVVKEMDKECLKWCNLHDWHQAVAPGGTRFLEDLAGGTMDVVRLLAMEGMEEAGAAGKQISRGSTSVATVKKKGHMYNGREQEKELRPTEQQVQQQDAATTQPAQQTTESTSTSENKKKGEAKSGGKTEQKESGGRE
jgi:hypothetical protein